MSEEIKKEWVTIKDYQGNVYKVIKTNDYMFKTRKEKIAEIAQLIAKGEIKG
jgi:hypothetical protein